MSYKEEMLKIVGEAIGQASMCWDFPEKAGEFQSEKASTIIDDVIYKIEDLHLKLNNQ